jgi:hypothetical protein
MTLVNTSSAGRQRGLRLVYWREPAHRDLLFRELQEMIAQRPGEEVPKLVGGEWKIGKSYFDGRRRENGGAAGFPVFGLLKRGGKVHSMIIHKEASDGISVILRRYPTTKVADERCELQELKPWANSPNRLI